MRHHNKTSKLGRTSKHRESMLANLAVSLIEHSRIKTTLAKAKAARPFAEKLVTLGKGGTLHARRLVRARIKQEEAVKKLFSEIAPRFSERKGGYTRIVKLGQRQSDSSKMAFLEWVDYSLPSEAAAPVEAAKSEPAETGDKK